MKLASRSPTIFASDPNHGANSLRIARRSLESHAYSGFARLISVNPGFRPVLGYRQIDASVTIEIADGGASLLTVDFDATFLPRHGPKATFAIAQQQQSAAGVVTRRL